MSNLFSVWLLFLAFCLPSSLSHAGSPLPAEITALVGQRLNLGAIRNWMETGKSIRNGIEWNPYLETQIKARGLRITSRKDFRRALVLKFVIFSKVIIETSDAALMQEILEHPRVQVEAHDLTLNGLGVVKPSVALADPLSKLVNLKSLELRRFNFAWIMDLKGIFTDRLQVLTNLQEFRLVKSRILPLHSEVFAEFVSGFYQLKSLRLTSSLPFLSNTLTLEAWLPVFQQFPGLKRLDLSGNSMGADAAHVLVRALERLPRLEELSLQGSLRTEGALRILSPSLDRIRSSNGRVRGAQVQPKVESQGSRSEMLDGYSSSVFSFDGPLAKF